MAVIWAMGITQHTTGVLNVLSLGNLQMLLGNMGVPGGGVNPLRGQNNVQGACDMGALNNVLPGYQRVIDPSVRQKFIDAWPLAGFGRKQVRVASRRGELVSRAVVTDRVPPGLVFANFHFPSEQNANNLTITSGGQLAALSLETMAALNSLLPAHCSHANPIDILGDADPDRYAKALEVAAQDPNSAILTSTPGLTNPNGIRRVLEDPSYFCDGCHFG